METNDAVSGLKLKLLLGLSWIFDHLNEFGTGKEKSHSRTKEDVALIKPLSELALTIDVLRRCGIALPVFDQILEWIWRETDRGKYITTVLLARNDFVPCCALYTSLFSQGYKSESLHTTLRMLSQMDMTATLPLQPWARLALEYNLEKLNLPLKNRIHQSQLYAPRCPEPWVISGETAYAITHELFYLSDFGFKPLIDEPLLEYLKTWIPYWSQKFIAASDYDVTGELAMVWNCIDAEENEEINNPLYSVLEYQQANGSLKGPEGAGSFLFKKGDSAERRIFLERYHTTLVLLMAIALRLRNARTEKTL